MADPRSPALFRLPVLSSRRGIIQALLGVAAVYGALFVLTDNERFSDGLVVALIAAAFIAVTAPLLDLNNPLSRLAVAAPFCVPVFIAAAYEQDTTLRLMMAAAGIELLIFIYLALQPGTAELTARGVIRRRLTTTRLSFDEIAEVKRISTQTGRIFQELGFAPATVEALLVSWRRVRFHVDSRDADRFVSQIARNIDSHVEHDMVFIPPPTKAPAGGPQPAATPPARSGRRRGKKSKQRRGQAA